MKKHLATMFLAALLVSGLGNACIQAQMGIAPAAHKSSQVPPPLAAAATTGNGIEYHGGPIMVNSHNVYLIWYGNWIGNTALTILPAFINGLSGSQYFSINTTYPNGSLQNMSSGITAVSQTTDNYSHGTSLSDSAVQSIVVNAILTGMLPRDTNGIYFVLTSADVAETSGFCTKYCGWHTHVNNFLAGGDIKYAFVGNAARCPSACAAQTTSPNGNFGADAMASVIAHEIDETVTDPDLNAWYHVGLTGENGDLCAWNFGTTFTTSNGSQANLTLGGNNYLIQQNWLNDGPGSCTMASTGNPFNYRNARDEFLSCYGIAGRISSNCTDVSELNDQKMCFAVSDSTQTPCQSMTDRNMELACFGIAFAPSFPTNCRDITNPQMQAFCYGVSSGGSNPAPNCSTVTDSNARALCNGMALHDPSFCSVITNNNDRLFCQGVSAHDNTFCANIQ